LAQKLRILEDSEEENLSSKDVKYVINSILSALDLESLEEEDKEDIMNKLEGIDDENPFDGGNDEMGDDEMGDDELAPDEELQPEVPSGEMGEGFGYEDVQDENPDDIEDELPNYRKPRHRHQSVSDDHSSRMEEMIEGLFSESKVDSILEKYFKVNEKEKQILESKIQKSTSLKEDRKEKISNIKKLSESISQEVASTKVINKYPEAKLIGKTNKNNLVFEMNNKQLRVNTKGQIL